MSVKYFSLLITLMMSIAVHAGTNNRFTISANSIEGHGSYQKYCGEVTLSIRNGSRLYIASDDITQQTDRITYQGNVVIRLPSGTDNQQEAMFQSDQVVLRKESDGGYQLAADFIRVY